MNLKWLFTVCLSLVCQIVGSIILGWIYNQVAYGFNWPNFSWWMFWLLIVAVRLWRSKLDIKFDSMN